MEKVIYNIILNVIERAGRIFGTALAIRLASEELERVKSMNKEMKGIIIREADIQIDFSDKFTTKKMKFNEIDVRLEKKISNKRANEILEEIVQSLIRAYSGVIGLVAKTIVKDAMKTVEREYGSKYPGIKKVYNSI